MRRILTSLASLPLRYLALISLVVVVACSPIQPAQTITVIDGDTVRVEQGDNVVQFDLAFIDAPEIEQPFGREAKNVLVNALSGTRLDIQDLSTPRELIVAGESVNLKLVLTGGAWCQRRIEDKAQAKACIQAQQAAMRQSLGVWGLEKPLQVPPWVWRKQGTQQLPRKRPPMINKSKTGN